MTNLKKKIPLSILEMLEPFLLKGIKNIRLIAPDNFLLKFIDNDVKSDFFFYVEEYKVESGTVILLVDRKPQSKDSVDNYRVWIEAKALEQYFNDWVGFLEKYENIKTIYDDPIEKKYQEEFHSEFEIVDEDADINSFNLNQQIWLDNYLDRVILTLERHQTNVTNNELNDIKTEVVELKNNLTNLTKKKVIEKLSKIWAKVRKHGLPLLKEIYIEARNELMKQLIEAQFGKIK